MKHVRMTHNGRGPPHTYYYLEWMYDQMRHGDYGTLVVYHRNKDKFTED